MSNRSTASGTRRSPREIVEASLKRRYATERRFRLFGASAVVLGLSFVLILFVSIVSKGYTAFFQSYVELPVAFNAELIDPSGKLAEGGLDEIEIARQLRSVNFLKLARDALRAEFPEVTGRTQRRSLDALLSPGAPLQLRQMVTSDPAVIGSERSVRLLVDDDVDMFMKGRSTPISRLDGTGVASVEGDLDKIGKAVVVRVTDDGLLPLLERARARLVDNADRLARQQARLQRSRDAQTALLEQGGLSDDQAGEAEREAARNERDMAQLETKIQALRAEAEGSDELVLSAEAPSFLLRINDGLIKLVALEPNSARGELLVPPASAAPAEAGTWETLELTTPQDARRLTDQQLAWVLQLQHEGLLSKRFNVPFFTNGTSREPELAGIAGAVLGSFYTLVLTLLFSFPIAVGAALYLEEFAPKNRITDLIEVNINNLAAVPSIVFGLLGLAVFINFFGVPRSTPLVAAMVLTLMTLPTIIIASRAALKSVPPSIREAALGVGASPLQTRLHHVLPLALPGMMTGTIIGMAQALGESAPLLMIGMIAFIVDIPQGFTDAATVLPVQIFLWADSPERGFVERTSAAIMVLLAFLILMNLTAVLLRRRFERRW
ncbi:phosphate ABC transporter, permease protein PstA [Lamprobacter modestohalophilus]|uniref:Phosphate transport system permease protein PstA n=1 Tax=Lamprobacter modestohalophilus TaxID=1064514 RepID=A0A9X0WAM1_9GAMM|nr:phosphate ABC transporter, permease protein PstA [Lamprobacter modestohalophilus]